MLKNYYDTTYTHNYILGVADKKNNQVKAYFVTLDFDALAMMFASPTTSRKSVVYRYKSNQKKVAYLEEHATRCMVVSDIDTFEKSLRIRLNKKGKEYRENRGEYFEYLMSQVLGVVQNELANLSHTEGGDLEFEGVAYQVKYGSAGIAVGHI